MTLLQFAKALPWLFSGLLIGGAYFFLLRRSVDVICGAADWRKAAGYLVLRLAIAICGFSLAAIQGAGPLLWALVGLLVTRTIVIRPAKGS